MDIAVYGDVHIHTAETKKEVKIHTIRTSDAVTTAKKNVRQRDKFCRCCGNEEMETEVHHIFPLSKYRELASDEANMVLLCSSCHNRYHNRYDLDSTNPLTFAEFIRNNGKEELKYQTD